MHFSKKLKKLFRGSYLTKFKPEKFTIEEISRISLDSKSKNKIIYCEFEIDSSLELKILLMIWY